jgi:hypothetical protein
MSDAFSARHGRAAEQLGEGRMQTSHQTTHVCAVFDQGCGKWFVPCSMVLAAAASLKGKDASLPVHLHPSLQNQLYHAVVVVCHARDTVFTAHC